jgi:hypothetical protein
MMIVNDAACSPHEVPVFHHKDARSQRFRRECRKLHDKS